MTRDGAIKKALAWFDDGEFEATLAARVALASESSMAGDGKTLRDYLEGALVPDLRRLGFSCRLLQNPVFAAAPFLHAERLEDPEAPTVLIYGHGDVVPGMEENWRKGLSPWKLTREGDRLYGRGTADNKGQHTINLGALAAVLAERGRLGFNMKALFEVGEEIGSPGLHAVVSTERANLTADLLVASDGPRLAPERPTLFLGSRGVVGFELNVTLRKGAHHSGNWGGIIADPGVLLAHALASIIDERGRIKVEGWRPREVPPAVRRALVDCAPDDGPEGEPAIDPDWGEPELSPAERLFAWPSFDILAFETGNPAEPASAVPPMARACCALRTTVDIDQDSVLTALRAHLDAAGFSLVSVMPWDDTSMRATRTDPGNEWVALASASVLRTTGRRPAILPNLGGSLPNDAFSEGLGIPTIWVPHSYAGCSQHAPNEHLLIPVVREGVAIMTGLFWDIGAKSTRTASTEPKESAGSMIFG